METEMEADVAGLFVKVSMDEAHYLRKINLKVYKVYKKLREALDGMFKYFSLVRQKYQEKKLAMDVNMSSLIKTKKMVT
ncbi:hypothetical protein ZIOFF_052379 [Zingiber officinale]|uniref:Auxin-responsive protein n=1 Tax=Zingiber officinale TaxID=94328 RepID=A0A8J5FM04_ZINOF|nr:hypothetical protein ZIOFF_052379 [Zingiber officinale]